VVLARYQLLTLRYTLGWFLVALSIGASGALNSVAKPIAEGLDLRPIELLLGISLAFLLLITVQLSITASGLTQMVRTVTESLALSEERIRRLERAGASQSGAEEPIPS
jgi:hypothetical protein